MSRASLRKFAYLPLPKNVDLGPLSLEDSFERVVGSAIELIQIGYRARGKHYLA
jgi:hypothetical protein